MYQREEIYFVAVVEEKVNGVKTGEKLNGFETPLKWVLREKWMCVCVSEREREKEKEKDEENVSVLQEYLPKGDLQKGLFKPLKSADYSILWNSNCFLTLNCKKIESAFEQENSRGKLCEVLEGGLCRFRIEKEEAFVVPKVRKIKSKYIVAQVDRHTWRYDL